AYALLRFIPVGILKRRDVKEGMRAGSIELREVRWVKSGPTIPNLLQICFVRGASLSSRHFFSSYGRSQHRARHENCEKQYVRFHVCLLYGGGIVARRNEEHKTKQRTRSGIRCREMSTPVRAACSALRFNDSSHHFP